jgi:outer membrane immunogenic protein
VFAAGAGSQSARSWDAGIRAGNNWQNGSLVYGIEADISATTLKTDFNTVLTGTFGPPGFASSTANTNANVEWYGTVRGRLGWSAGQALFYGTGGLAYGSVDMNNTMTAPPPFAPPTNTQGVQISDNRIGWVAGGGIEYLWRPNVIFSLAYQYVDLGTVSFPISPSAAFVQSGSAHAQFQTVTFGVSWLFSPSDKKPHGTWEGEYIGGYGGGDWGNRTSATYSDSAFAISDARLKRDITLIGHLDDGLGLYSFRYLWSDTVYVGVMAQEVAATRPDAAARGADGYLRVNYGKLGLQMRTLAQWQALTYGLRL